MRRTLWYVNVNINFIHWPLATESYCYLWHRAPLFSFHNSTATTTSCFKVRLPHWILQSSQQNFLLLGSANVSIFFFWVFSYELCGSDRQNATVRFSSGRRRVQALCVATSSSFRALETTIIIELCRSFSSEERTKILCWSPVFVLKSTTFWDAGLWTKKFDWNEAAERLHWGVPVTIRARTEEITDRPEPVNIMLSIVPRSRLKPRNMHGRSEDWAITSYRPLTYFFLEHSVSSNVYIP